MNIQNQKQEVEIIKTETTKRSLVIHFHMLPLWLLGLLQESTLLVTVKNTFQHKVLREQTWSHEEMKASWVSVDGFFGWLRGYFEEKSEVLWGLTHAQILITPQQNATRKPDVHNLEKCQSNGHQVSLVISITDQKNRMIPICDDESHYEQVPQDDGTTWNIMQQLSLDDADILCEALFPHPEDKVAYKWLNYWRRHVVDSSLVLTAPESHKTPQCHLHKMMAKRGLNGPGDLLSPILP